MSQKKRSSSHSHLTDWPDNPGPARTRWTQGRTLTCGYGLRCTGWTGRTGLPNGRLGLPSSYGPRSIRGLPGGSLPAMGPEAPDLFTRLAPVLNLGDLAAERAFYESSGYRLALEGPNE